VLIQDCGIFFSFFDPIGDAVARSIEHLHGGEGEIKKECECVSVESSW
jgi:hypothetical protein